MANDTAALMESLGKQIAASIKPAKQLRIENKRLAVGLRQNQRMLNRTINEISRDLRRLVSALSDELKRLVANTRAISDILNGMSNVAGAMSVLVATTLGVAQAMRLVTSAVVAAAGALAGLARLVRGIGVGRSAGAPVAMSASTSVAISSSGGSAIGGIGVQVTAALRQATFAVISTIWRVGLYLGALLQQIVVALTTPAEGGGRDLLSDAGTIASLVGLVLALVAAAFTAGFIGATAALVIAVVATIAGLVAFIALHWETVSGWLATVWNALVGLTGSVWNAIAFLIAIINPPLALAALLLSLGFTALMAVISGGMAFLGILIVGLGNLMGIAGSFLSTVAGYISMFLPFLGQQLAFAAFLLSWLGGHVADVGRKIIELSNVLWDVVEWLAERIRSAISGIAGAIGDIGGGIWDSTLGRVFHGGGVVPGSRGSDVSVLAQAGEGIFTRDQMAAIGTVGGGGPVSVVIDGAGLDRRMLEWLRHAVRVEGGGSVQTALGQ